MINHVDKYVTDEVVDNRQWDRCKYKRIRGNLVSPLVDEGTDLRNKMVNGIPKGGMIHKM